MEKLEICRISCFGIQIKVSIKKLLYLKFNFFEVGDAGNIKLIFNMKNLKNLNFPAPPTITHDNRKISRLSVQIEQSLPSFSTVEFNTFAD
jgi:hypothetical protein